MYIQIQLYLVLLDAYPWKHFFSFASFVHHGPHDLYREREHNGGVPLSRDGGQSLKVSTENILSICGKTKNFLHLSWRAAGEALIVSEASFSALEACCSPWASMT